MALPELRGTGQVGFIVPGLGEADGLFVGVIGCERQLAGREEVREECPVPVWSPVRSAE